MKIKPNFWLWPLLFLIGCAPTVVEDQAPSDSTAKIPLQQANHSPAELSKFSVCNLHQAIVYDEPAGKPFDSLNYRAGVKIDSSISEWLLITSGKSSGWVRKGDIFEGKLPALESFDQTSDSVTFAEYFSEIGTLSKFEEPYFLEYTITGMDVSMEGAYQILKFFYKTEEWQTLPRYLPRKRFESEHNNFDLFIDQTAASGAYDIQFQYPGGVTGGGIESDSASSRIWWYYSGD